MQKTAILILAAGSSSRMGTVKQLLPYKHTTFLGWAIEQAQNSAVNNVICVLGANAAVIEKKMEKSNTKILYNPNFKNGLSSSITVGINHLEEENIDTVLIMLADQPNVTTIYLNELIKTSEENQSKIIVSNYQEQVGVPAVFPKSYFKKLKTIQGDKGAKEFLNEHTSEIIKMAPFNLIDIDTLEEYISFLKKE